MGVLGRDPRFYEEGTGLEAVESSPVQGGSMSLNASEMWISLSSEDVVEVREASEEQVR